MKKSKNIIRECLLKIEQEIHGQPDSFTPMEAQMIFNIIEDFHDQCKELGKKAMKEEIVELIKSNSKGSFTDDGGNDCWYIDSLLSAIEELSALSSLTKKG
jgi:hypothetical protein